MGMKYRRLNGEEERRADDQPRDHLPAHLAGSQKWRHAAWLDAFGAGSECIPEKANRKQ